MKKQGIRFEDLRMKAEEVLVEKKGHSKKLTLEINELIHELEVHQIELEIQNENLIKTQILLEESRRDYVELYDFAPVGYFTFDKNWIIKRVNLTGFTILGIPRKFLINTAFVRYIDPSYRKIFYEHCQEVKESHEKNHCELELLSKEKSPFFASLDSIMVSDKGGKFKEFRTILTDITERKRAEKEIEESNNRLKAIIDAIPDLMFEVDAEGRFYDYNAPVMDELYVPPEQFLGKTVSEVLPPEAADKIMEALKEAAEKGKHQGKTYKLSFPGGTRYFELSIAKKSISKSKPHFIALTHDITQREKAKEQIKQSLREKEILLKEIHHRVKNNLQVISSLLNMQSAYIKDKNDQELFRESQTRARAMALIHERLYQSTDLRSIDFGEYIRTLVWDLYRIYGCKPDTIQLKMDLEPVPVDINAAIPCGLIINELMSNAIKHAFPDDQKGEITIKFYQKDHKLILTVKDNGIGFPADIGLDNASSLGLTLVNTLVNQIGGEIEINLDGGTEVTITFPEVEFD
ncbi:sensor histidine kinase [Methanobacterium ferruginis]|uniref:sensor histidine kinase n=1 Tax=Methanobacterium ferruginis TaxID=710191 RepID=UPI002572D4B6|nr:histidine kinase dimerization/phosphoacceptor domain -containing protein [Methanobacterium ferruginis]BDZ66948.1 hypothetical protein GCM10025860_03960 [Methanobacterium ferruginis]